MKKTNLLVIVLLLVALNSNYINAQYVNIPITGFTRDAVANGNSTSTASTSGTTDGTYVFIDGTFAPGGTICQTIGVWPSSNTITSLTTPGLTYTLMSPTVYNTFQVSGGGSGTLTITTPIAVSNLRLLAAGGNGTSNFSATVTFSDATTQAFTGLSVVDWCNGTNPATYQFYRTTRNTSTTCNTTLCQYMYEVNLAINPANYSKNVSSISFTHQSGSGRLNIFALAGNTNSAYLLPTPSSLAFGYIPFGNTSTAQSFSLIGNNLSSGGGNISVTAPTGFSLSSTSGGTYTATLIIPYTGTSLPATDVFVKFTPLAANTPYTGNLSISGGSATSTVALTGTSLLQYCTTGLYTSGCTDDDYLSAFSLATINQTGLTCTSGNAGYNNFTTTVAPPTLAQGQPYAISGTAAYPNNQYIRVWIDFNDDGIFNNTTEVIYVSQAISTSFADNFSMPLTATLGTHRMRVRLVYNNTGFDACTSYQYGCVNDYTVTIVAAPPCATPANQPTDFNLSPGTSSITGSFTPSAGNPGADHYLVIKSTSPTLTATPVNGTIYTAGNAFGGGTVLGYYTSPTFVDATLTLGTHYYYFVFAANSNCVGNVLYLTTNPLQNDILWSGSTFTSSNLPIIVINTNNVSIPDEPKIPGRMGIIYNGPGIRNYLTDPFNNYNNNIGIELRGSTSQGFPQKPYSIETRDKNGLEHDTIVLDMPEENAWILYPPYNDKTCLRNTLTYHLSNKMGHYATRTKFCELVVNNTYMGIYVWMEKIKQGDDRVDIAKLDSLDITGDALTGGYIFKIDKTTGTGGNDGWNSIYPTAQNHTIRFLYHYPKSVDIVSAQTNYIKAYVDSFEIALKSTNFADPITGYRNFIDVNSFIDYFILSEFTKNVDGYRLSTFLHKRKNSDGRKLVCGPAWDYNIALGNANYMNGSQTSGWAYVENTSTGDVPFWWARFLQDPGFTSSLKCRWNELRQTIFSNAYIMAHIDSTKALLNESQGRHFAKWPILGVYTWPNPSPYPTSYAGEINAIKTWIANRLAWMDANMPGTATIPLVNLGSDTAICPGQFMLDAGNTGSSYLWNTGATTQTITLTNAGTYSVLVNNNGCKNRDTITISINPLPVAIAGNDTSICEGSPITLNASGGIYYDWNHGVTQGVSFIPVATETYTVTVTATNQCKNSDSILVTLIPTPPQPIITMTYGSPITLSSNIVLGNQWYKDGNILLGENGQTLLVSPLVSGVYTDIVTQDGCTSPPSDVQTVFASISEENNQNGISVYPNPFTAQTNISYTLSEAKQVVISIYDVTARQICVLANTRKEKGEHRVSFDAGTLPSGVYYYTLSAGEDTYTGKIIKISL